MNRPPVLIEDDDDDDDESMEEEKIVLFNRYGLKEGGVYQESVDAHSRLGLPEDMFRDYVGGLVQAVGDHAVKVKNRLDLSDWEELPLPDAIDKILVYAAAQTTKPMHPPLISQQQRQQPHSSEDDFVYLSSGSSDEEEENIKDLERLELTDDKSELESSFVIAEGTMSSVGLDDDDDDDDDDADDSGSEEMVIINHDDSMIPSSVRVVDESEGLPFATSNVRQPVALRMEKKGHGALPPLTVMQCFDDVVKKHGRKPALHQKPDNPADTRWSTWTWKKYRQNVDSFAKSLIHIGLEPFDIVNIIGSNSREWFTASFGTIAAGGVSVGVFATSNQKACKYVAHHSKAKVIVVHGLKQLEKIIPIVEELKRSLKAIVVYGADELLFNIEEECPLVPVFTFSRFLELGNDVPDDRLRSRIDGLRPNQTCTVVYTSGTTGEPKAVMITHDNITFTARMMIGGSLTTVTNNDSLLSFLDLAVVGVQILDMYSPLLTGCQVCFAHENVHGSLAATLKDVRPTIFHAVPQIWEEFRRKFSDELELLNGKRKRLIEGSRAITLNHWESREAGAIREPVNRLKRKVAQRILRTIRAPMGLDRVRIAHTSGSLMDGETLRFFLSIDIPVMPAYGQAECTGQHCINTHQAFKLDTVGPTIQGTNSKVDETGQLCYAGRHVFVGYMNNPQLTERAFDGEHFRSGDIGEIVTEQVGGEDLGFVKIKCRLNELVELPGRPKVTAPSIERIVKSEMPALSNCMVVECSTYLIVLLCLRVKMDKDGTPTTLLDPKARDLANISSQCKTTDEARNNDRWKEYFDIGLVRVNRKIHPYHLRRWALLDADFSQRHDELTPSGSVRREAIKRKYADFIRTL